MATNRRLTAIILLVAIGLPASLGVGLHLGQADCCDEFSVCQDCPFSHASPANKNEDPDRIVAAHDCLICDFLATAKDAWPADMPEVALDLLPIPASDDIMSPAISGGALAFLARGPPASFPAL